MPRQARLDSPGTVHHVRIRGIEGGDIVSGEKDREQLVSRMGDPAEETGTKIYTLALKLNYSHVLLPNAPANWE